MNNNVSNDCDFPSIEINNTSMLNTTLNNHLDSGNIATRVNIFEIDFYIFTDIKFYLT